MIFGKIMTIYLVFLFEPNDKIFAEIERRFFNSKGFRVSNTVYAIRSNKTAEQISKDIGLDGNRKYMLPNADDATCGVVLKWSNLYFGYASEEFWNWLDG